jgi:hypothetical protein
MNSKKLNTELPAVGMGVTINYWSDRDPATVIQVLHNGRRLILQKDIAVRIDTNGMSECQDYDFFPDAEGSILHASLRKDGTYRLIGSQTTVHLGSRRKYHDYSF